MTTTHRLRTWSPTSRVREGTTERVPRPRRSIRRVRHPTARGAAMRRPPSTLHRVQRVVLPLAARRPTSLQLRLPRAPLSDPLSPPSQHRRQRLPSPRQHRRCRRQRECHRLHRPRTCRRQRQRRQGRRRFDRRRRRRGGRRRCRSRSHYPQGGLQRPSRRRRARASRASRRATRRRRRTPRTAAGASTRRAAPRRARSTRPLWARTSPPSSASWRGCW